MQDKAEGQLDISKTYEIMTEMCGDEEIEDLNQYGVNVKTPEICPWKITGE